MHQHQAASHLAHRSHKSVIPRPLYQPKQPSIPFSMALLKTFKNDLDAYWPYIGENAWEGLRIRCQPLDINNPHAAPGGKYFQLVPAQLMQTYAQEHEVYLTTVDIDASCTCNQNFDTAYYFIDRLDSSFVAIHNHMHLSDRLGWESREPDTFEKHCLSYHPTGDTAFQSITILEPTGGSLPHIMCTLSDVHLHKEDSLLFSEVYSMLILTLLVLRQPKNENHLIVPITIVSASDWQYRIVQGYVDGKKGTLCISKSPIMHVNRDGQALADFEFIMRWLLAKPTGDTTKAH
ncbi:hypothetical protein F5Y03DRAFT_380567 [Xylaria venustula]|nr:hypothetical protein F5Y03DRAFT_380567 [Xylaria venustula]